jgi:hypothetical protein
MNAKMFARIKDMNTGMWEYVKVVSKSQSKTIPAFLDELIELHAKSTKRTNLLKTLLAEYSGEDKEDSNNEQN